MIKYHKLHFVLFIVFSTFYFGAYSQTGIKISGNVTDSLKKPVEGVSIILISPKDTLRSTTDVEGRFSLFKSNHDNFYLQLTALGYKGASFVYEVQANEKTLILKPIILKADTIQLKDVEVKAKVDPIKIKKDTIEYNAAAYTVRKDDMVEDLLRQLQGVEIDANGAVTAMGKPMTKLRVNGKDFFTGNVEDYIRQLPANIIAKLQVIDDYGDMANFTGLKIGPPQKMLNLVIKPGMDNGIFGGANERSATTNAHNLNLNTNFWKQTKQIGFGTGYGVTSNELTTSNNENLNGNIRTPLSKSTNFNANYSLSNNSNRSSNSQYLETFNPQGSIYDLQNRLNNSSGLNNSLNLGLNSSTKHDFFSMSLSGGLSNNMNDALSTSNKTGLIRQDLFSNSNVHNSSPRVSGNFQYSMRPAHSNSSLSIGLNFSRSQGNSESNIGDIIKYYNETTNLLVKDSLLNRLVSNNTLNSSISTSVQFSKSLTKPNDTIGQSYLSLSFNFSLNKSENLQTTNVTNSLGILYPVDSLGEHFISTTISQSISLNFNRNQKKVNYNLGLHFSPNLIIGRYPVTNESIKNYQTNFSPTAGLNYQLKENKNLNFNYTGNTSSPPFNELQPVKNTSNVQNIIVGNPNLKATSNHSVNLSYNQFGAKSGLGVMFGLSGNVAVNSTITKTVFLKDTLNSLKQRTTYENVNGNYNLSANYSVNKRLFTNKLSLSTGGNIGYNHNVFYTDTVLNASKGINISNSVNISLNEKKFSLNTNASYSFSSNTYSVMNQNISNVQVLALSGGGSWIASRKFRFNMSASKSFNFGYSLATGRPLIVNMGLNSTFLKSDKLGFSVQANDVFNQGVVFGSVINNNSISQNRTKFISRVVQATLNYNLSHFGSKK